MRFSSLLAASAAFSGAWGINILLTNDDGFGAANIREFYKQLKTLGHNVWLVASSSDQSGMGGRAVFTTAANLTANTEWDIVKAGAPSIGTDPNDSHIWYYNGTPATQIFVALDYVLPNFADFKTPDLVLSGPNFGLNLGPFLYTISGTIGATYAAVERGLPAIAFSGGYAVQTPYYWVNASTKAGLQDPATIYGRLAASLAQSFIDKAQASGGRILPLGYGINVNLPYITSFVNDSCVNPPYVLTRFTGGATSDQAVFNKTSGLFTYASIVPDGANQCINGDCGLPGEQEVLSSGCKSSVTVFTVDYDAPYSGRCSNNTNPYSLVPSLVQLANSTTLVGALGKNASVAGSGSGSGSGNVSVTASPTPSSTSTAKPTTTANIGGRAELSFGGLIIGLCVALAML